MKKIKKEAKARKEEKTIKVLSTKVGQERYLQKEDTKTLEAIMKLIESVTEKPVFRGFAFNANVERIVGICNALQYMKGNLRENIEDTLWNVFTDDLRDQVLEAYGRLPYLAEPTLIEVNGQMIDVDPEAVERAKAGVQADVASLETLVNIIALDLGLDGEYTVTQAQADKAWNIAVNKLKKNEILQTYKESLQ